MLCAINDMLEDVRELEDAKVRTERAIRVWGVSGVWNWFGFG